MNRKLLVVAAALCGAPNSDAATAIRAHQSRNDAANAKACAFRCAPGYGRCWWRPNYYRETRIRITLVGLASS